MAIHGRSMSINHPQFALNRWVAYWCGFTINCGYIMGYSGWYGQSPTWSRWWIITTWQIRLKTCDLNNIFKVLRVLDMSTAEHESKLEISISTRQWLKSWVINEGTSWVIMGMISTHIFPKSEPAGRFPKLMLHSGWKERFNNSKQNDPHVDSRKLL